MRSTGRYIIILFAILFFANIGCKSYSKFTIDEKPLIKVDTTLLGLWKVAEDTDKANFIVIQGLDDNLNYSDSNILSNYKDPVSDRKCTYYLTYMNHHGKNPLYTRFDCFQSIVNGQTFFNVRYSHTLVFDKPVNGSVFGKSEEGYFFAKLIKRLPESMVVAIVADTSMKYLNSSKEVRTKIEKNLNRREFYSDTVHLFKISAEH